MKKIFAVAGLFVFAAAGAQNKFTIKGTVNGSPVPIQKVMIYYRAGAQNMVDSADLKNNSYTFTGIVDEPTQVTLLAKYPLGSDGKPLRILRSRDLVMAFVEPGETAVSSVDSFANATVKGLKAQEAFTVLDNMLRPLNRERSIASAAYYKAMAEKNMAARHAAENAIDSIDNLVKAAHKTYLLQNPSSPIALYALIQAAGYDIDANEAEPLFNHLSAAQRAYPSAKVFAEALAIAKKTSVGALAMDFSQNDTLGKPLKLSSFRGKYVLIDFWASWCGPCREENPNVVKAYQAFRNKNFEILGVSLDRPNAKDRWLDAIHQDNLTWTHVSDLKFWQNEVARLYGIEAIPQNLLVDPSGKIIAKNLSGEKLNQKLAEIFNKP